MNNKIIAIFLLLAMTTTAMIPMTEAQAPPDLGYQLSVTNPVVFLASDISGNISGPNGTEYQIFLVNMTSFESFPISSGVFNSSYQNNYTRYLNADYYPAGRYTVNLTIDGETVMFVQVSIVYNQAFVFAQKLKEIIETLTTLSYGVQNLFDRMEANEEHDRRVDWILFIVMVCTIIMVFIILYFVILRVLKARLAYSKERAAYNMRKMIGLPCDPTTWADLEQKLGPENTRPNLNPIPQILIAHKVPPALAEECLLDIFADFGMASVMEKEMTHLEKRKLTKQKAAKEKAVKP